MFNVHSQEPETAELLIDVALLDAKIVEAEAEVANLEAKSGAEERMTRERKEDLKRLKRVEVIYVSKGWALHWTLIQSQS